MVTATELLITSARVGPVAGVEPAVDRGDPRRDILDHWSAALARGDGAEVDRLVQKSRLDRVAGAARGQLGAMLG